MADNNRLELDIIAKDDTGPAVAKAKANFKSMDEAAAESAVSMSQSFDTATASVLRSLQTLETRAALAGRTGIEKLTAQKQILIDRAGSDEAAVNRISAAYDKLFTVQQRLDRQAATRSAGISAGKATLSGEAEFQAALKAVQSRDSELRALEDRAKRATLSKPDFLRNELGGILSQRGVTDSAAQRYRAAYADLIKAAEEEEKHSGGHGSGSSMVLRRGFLGIKDAIEGRTQGTVIEAADILMGTSGGGGILPGVVTSLGEMTGLGSTAVIAIGSIAAAFAGLQLAGLGAMKSLAEYGQEVENVHLRTGISVQNVEQFAFAAKMGGQDVTVFEKMMRGLTEAESDNSSAGTKARAEMERLGVSTRDATGQLKPTEQVLLELSTALEKLPPGTQRNAAAMEIFKRVGIEAIPVISSLTENVARAKELGLGATKEDMERWEEYHRKITEASAIWDNFVRRIKGYLAATVVIAFGDSSGKILHPDDLRKMGVNPRYAGSDSSSLSAQTQADRSVFPPGATTAGLDVKGIGGYADQVAAYNRKKADLAKFEQSPEQQLSVAEDQLRAIGKPTVDNLAEYKTASERVRRLKEADKASKDNAQDLVAAAKERQQLLSESAQIAESSQLKNLSASLDSRKELASPQDIDNLMDLAKRRAIAEENKSIDDRRDAKGFVSSQFLDQENANLSQRVENEQAKVLADIAAQDSRYFRARTDADAKAWEESWQRRKRGELELQQDEINIRQQMQSKQFDINGSAIDRQKEMALQGLDGANAQTLQQKIALEDQKFAIEQTYAEKSLENQIAKLQNEQAVKIAQVQRDAAATNNTGSEAEAAKIAATRDEYQQQIDAARGATSDREIIDAQKTQAAKERLQIESGKRVYDSLKQNAAGLFDQLVSHTKSWGDFAKDLFKSAILTPVKDIFSSQVAALFTKGLTGQDVTFGEVGNGQGTFGKLGSIFGRAGLGQPRFGTNEPHKLEQPGHLGDLSLVQGAVPVVLMNANGGSPAGPTSNGAGFSFGSLAAGLGIGGLLSGGASAVPAAAATASSYSFPDGIIDATSSPGTFSSLANLVGGPGGTSGFAGPVAGYGGSSAGSGGFGGILSNLGGLFGGGSSGTDLGNGVGIANTGILGRLAAFGKSGGAAILGGSVALDGIRRGGVTGTLEAAGGGALTGFKYGGPIGALIGAAVGGGIAGFKSIFGNDRQHAKDLVKQVYGMDINNATADQIIAIAKQSYGNQIDVAVRSPQVRDLLKLYAQTVGNKSAQDQFEQSQVHSASFVESGGKLQQQAIYDNGNAYAYSSPLATYGGVATSPLSTFAPNQGVFNGNLQINLNGQSASDALAGQVVRVATPGFVQGQALAASNSSIGRTAQQNMTLSPSALRS